MTYFNDLGLADPILRAVTEAGYKQPTPIQQDVIPAMIAGKDIIGIAQTGTGKTAAFVLPILNRISETQGKPHPKTCRTLILTPTRELAQQIADCIQTYAKFMRLSTAVIVGGVKPGPQIRACARGLDIIIATPGRLLDHLGTGAVKLDQTFQVIADEADQMMDMGFLPSIRKIMQALPKKRQTVLLSATMPAQIRSLAKDFMSDPLEISVAPVSKPIERIVQSIECVEKAEKKRTLATLLADKAITRAVVFTRTKHGANKVAAYLVNAGQTALAIHGNKSQSQREKSLASFKAGTTKVLVATDIAARGIDIDGVSHVINFELPNVPESYVHRIGRTARAGRSGTAVSLCDPSELPLLRDIEKLTGQNLLPLTDEEKAREQQRPQPKKKQASSGNKRSGNKNRRQASGKKRPQEQGPAANKSKPNSRSRRRNQHKKPGLDKPTDGLMRVLGETRTQAAAGNR